MKHPVPTNQQNIAIVLISVIIRCCIIENELMFLRHAHIPGYYSRHQKYLNIAIETRPIER